MNSTTCRHGESARLSMKDARTAGVDLVELLGTEWNGTTMKQLNGKCLAAVALAFLVGLLVGVDPLVVGYRLVWRMSDFPVPPAGHFYQISVANETEDELTVKAINLSDTRLRGADSYSEVRDFRLGWRNDVEVSIAPSQSHRFLLPVHRNPDLGVVAVVAYTPVVDSAFGNYRKWALYLMRPTVPMYTPLQRQLDKAMEAGEADELVVRSQDLRLLKNGTDIQDAVHFLALPLPE